MLFIEPDLQRKRKLAFYANNPSVTTFGFPRSSFKPDLIISSPPT